MSCHAITETFTACFAFHKDLPYYCQTTATLLEDAVMAKAKVLKTYATQIDASIVSRM